MASVVVWGIAQATGWVAGATATALIQIGVGAAFSALSVAMANKAANRNTASGAVRTQTTTAGDQTPQSFILGTYATAGNLVCPDMSHGVDGDTRYLTRVLDVSDIQCDSLDSLIVDGKTHTMSGATHADYGPTTNRTDFVGYFWAKFYDGSQSTADAMLISKYGSYPQRPWSSDMRFRGIAYLILTFLWRNTPQLWNGSPQVTAVINGIRLYDPRKDSTAGGSGSHRYGTQSTHEWSENPVVMIYNILRGIVMLGGNTYGGGSSAADLPYATWAAAMNACDVTISGRKTYIAGYEVKIGTPDIGGDNPLDVIDELLKACSGEIADVGGTIYIRVGGPALPVKYLTDEDILRSSPQDLDPFPPAESSFNGVHATYPSPSQLWQAREVPPRYDTAAEAEDGERLIADLTLPAVPHGTQVQQLMKAWLKDEMRRRRHNITLPPEGVLLKPLDVIDWTSTRNGYIGKDFEISQVGIEARTLSTTLSIREKDPDDYDWVVGDEIATTAPSVTPVVNSAQAVPGWDVLGVAIKDDAGSDRRPAIRLVYTPDLPGVTGINYQVRVKATGVVIARGTIGDTDDGLFNVTSGILPATEYEGRGRLVMPSKSAWTSWENATTPNLRVNTADVTPNAITVAARVKNNKMFDLTSSTWVVCASLSIVRASGFDTDFTISASIDGYGTASVQVALFRGSEQVDARYDMTGPKGTQTQVSFSGIDTDKGGGKVTYTVRARRNMGSPYKANSRIFRTYLKAQQFKR